MDQDDALTAAGVVTGKLHRVSLTARPGLLVWISYLATGVTGLAWAACGLLLAVASLGMTLVFLGPASMATARRSADGPVPAGHPPVFVIATHIIAACITILLATLAAIGAG